jgi:hypothetical protein
MSEAALHANFSNAERIAEFLRELQAARPK